MSNPSKAREKGGAKKSLQIFIGKKVQFIRSERGYSQEDLADLTGMTRVSITNIEAGRQAINLRVLYIICCVVNESPSFFFPPLRPVQLKKKVITKRIIVEKKRFIPIK